MRSFILFTFIGLAFYAVSLGALLLWQKYPATYHTPRWLDAVRLGCCVGLLIWAAALLLGGAA